MESDSPREADSVLADEPLVRVGMLDGPIEYLFGDIAGAVRLRDGSLVVADEQSYNVRKFDASGQHVWTSGRQGQGLGEYRGLWLLRGCPGAEVTVFDWSLDRITELRADCSVAEVNSLTEAGVNPYQRPVCSPTGDLVFQGWPDHEFDGTTRADGERYRWETALEWMTDDGVVTLRSGIPGAERFAYSGGSGPVTWGRDMAFAVVATGVWYGSADD